MHRVVPELIVENYRLGRYHGEFSAVVMFLDLSGFSTMTDALMQYGQHGAEVLAGLMHGVFDPLVESVFDYGGKIIGFAGDGMMALYPVEGDAASTALHALTSAYVIQSRLGENATHATVYGTFSVSAKIGLAAGSVSWGILRSSDGNQATYYFRGSAVDDAAEAEHRAKSGDILIAPELRQLLQDRIDTTPYGSLERLDRLRFELPSPNRIIFPPVDLNVSRLFMPAEVVAYDVRGEFRQVVNLFMRFPDLSEPQLHDLMDKVFELRGKYGGLLSRVDFGDKGCNLLMLWGAPVAYDNDIGRALNFLLDLKSQVDFPITSGVTYYIAHAGYLGSSMCEDYTCYGWGVNLASRFMMSAPSGETWVDDRIARRVSKRFAIESVGSQMFKGFAAEQKVHRLSGYRQAIEPIYQGELVGREEELARLAKFIEPLEHKRFAGLMLISGDAGAGKGRLVYELRTSKMFGGEKLLWAICQSDQILRQSFNPWRSWLYKYFEVSTSESQEERKPLFTKKLDELLATIPDPELGREVDRTRSFLGALLDLYWDGSLYAQLDAEGRHNNTLLALIALLKAESLRQPVVIYIEDFQFIDNDSKDFLPRLKRAFLASTESFPIAIIVTTRPSASSLAEDLVDARMDLRGISRQAIAHLAEIMLGGPAAPTLVALLANRSEGNPYFAEQIIRYLQEENFIEMSRDGWSLVRRLREDFLPGDIRSILVARLDQLTREVKLSIQTASILGREFELQVLLQMLRDDNAITYVDEAEKAAIWAPLNEIRYIFTHGLLRDAAYEMQMRARRQELHALAVDALESLYADDLKAHYAALAYHADHAYLSEKAQKYYRLAGKVAADLYQNSQGIDYFTRALTHTLPDDLRTQFEILTERVGLLNRMGERDSQLKDIDSLETLAQQIGDNRLLIQAKILHAQYCFTMGDYACTIEMSEEVAAKAKELGQAELALTVYVVWSQAHFRLGDLQESMTYATDGLNLARQAGKRLEEGRALSSMGLIALESKEPGKAQEYLEEAVVIAREIKDRTLESRAIANLANSAAYVQRDYMTARAYYEQANALNGELGDRYAQGIALGNIGWACGMLGDFAAAQKYHEQALLIAREIGNLYHETHILMNLSGVAEAQGKPQEAVQYALHANSLCKEKADKQSEAWSWLYLGYAYLADGELENARTAFEQALNLRRERGQHSLATEPAAGLIQVALRVDDLPLASRLTEEILSYLSADGTLEGAEEPARVYLACYSALERTGDSRASVLLDTAMHMLESQILKINDEQARRMYIQNVPWRWAIEQTWLAKNKESRERYRSQGRPD